MVNSKNGAVFLILFTFQLLQRWGVPICMGERKRVSIHNNR